MGYFAYKGDEEIYIEDEIEEEPKPKKKIVFNKKDVTKCSFCGFVSTKRGITKHIAAKHGSEP